MKRVLVLIPLMTAALAHTQPPEKRACLIVSQHKHTFGENMARWTVAKPYNWVEGEYPKGVKFNHELGNKQIQKIQAAGGKVVVVKNDYSPAELEDARKQCKEFQTEAK